ncbi:MAG: hypothetical protein PHI01_03135, partial [Candidatus Izemoplasmatales bacterium]|nr:hypothetical protein [Candidatus Izemoplasmatales bacterium]
DLQGYLVDNRLYAYLYDEDFTYTNPETDTKQSVVLTIPMMAPGNYTIRYYDTMTGAEIGSDTLVQLTSGTFSLTLPDFTNDIALIAESNQE